MSGFDLLPLAQKMKVIKINGREVSQFSYNDEVIILYRIGDDTLVQTAIDSNSKKITKISSMDHVHFLKYLPHLSLQSILMLMTN